MEQTRSTPASTAPSLTRDVAQLTGFDGEPRAFLATLLEMQCRIGGAGAAGLLAIESSGAVRVELVRPPLEPGGRGPAWLVKAMTLAAETANGRAARVVAIEHAELYGDRVPEPHLVLVPARLASGRHAVAVLLVEGGGESLSAAQERFELTCGLLGTYDARLELGATEDRLERLRTAMEILDAVNEQARFKGAAIALCGEVASRWGAERVAVGFLHERFVKTAAISNMERFDRKTRVVQDVESAMEECLDQDVEIIHPRPEEATFVSRAAEQLSLRHGPVSVVSLPLRHERRPVGILTVERAIDDPPGLGEIETLRVVCELLAPRLLELRRRDRWIGARAASAVRSWLAMLIGAKHTGKKLLAAGVFASVTFLVVGQGEDRIEASFEIAAVERRTVPAPFDGRLTSVDVDPGDRAVAGETVLAELETTDLRMELAAARAEHASYLKEADLAMREARTVEVQIAQANLERVEAQMRLLEYRIDEATLVASIDGTVVSGDLRRNIGAPVETGDVLFEIAQLEHLRAELEVPEDRITDLMNADGTWDARGGRLASISKPGDYIPFEIEHVNPVAEVVGQRNVFRVRVRLLEDRSWLRPGMKGVAKVSVGRRSYGALWTRRLVNWVRMRLWV